MKEKTLLDAAYELNLKLGKHYGFEHPKKFIVGLEKDNIFVFAPEKYEDIPENFEGFQIIYRQSDCASQAQY